MPNVVVVGYETFHYLHVPGLLTLESVPVSPALPQLCFFPRNLATKLQLLQSICQVIMILNTLRHGLVQTTCQCRIRQVASGRKKLGQSWLVLLKMSLRLEYIFRVRALIACIYCSDFLIFRNFSSVFRSCMTKLLSLASTTDIKQMSSSSTATKTPKALPQHGSMISYLQIHGSKRTFPTSAFSTNPPSHLAQIPAQPSPPSASTPQSTSPSSCHNASPTAWFSNAVSSNIYPKQVPPTAQARRLMWW